MGSQVGLSFSDEDDTRPRSSSASSDPIRRRPSRGEWDVMATMSCPSSPSSAALSMEEHPAMIRSPMSRADLLRDRHSVVIERRMSKDVQPSLLHSLGGLLQNPAKSQQGPTERRSSVTASLLQRLRSVPELSSDDAMIQASSSAAVARRPSLLQRWTSSPKMASTASLPNLTAADISDVMSEDSARSPSSPSPTARSGATRPSNLSGLLEGVGDDMFEEEPPRTPVEAFAQQGRRPSAAVMEHIAAGIEVGSL